MSTRTLRLLLTASDSDKNLSRLDPTLLSPQAQMDIAFQGTENKTDFTDEDGNFRDIHEWPDIDLEDIYDEKEDNNVLGIFFSVLEGFEDSALGGTINFRFLPESIVDLHLEGNELHGTVQTRDLPKSLWSLILSFNW